MKKLTFRKKFLLGGVNGLLVIMVMAAIVVYQFSTHSRSTHAASTGTFTNPIAPALSADPFITYANGNYYYTWTGANGIQIKSSPSLATLGNATPTTVYQGLTQGEMFWVPSYNRWYIYDNDPGGGNVGKILESSSTDPLSSYTMKNENVCAGCWDLTLLTMSDGSLYLLSSASGGGIQIQALSNPWTPTSAARTIIARHAPSATDWEWVGNQYGCCVEDPFAFWHNGQLWMTFAGNLWSSGNYAVGLAKFNGGDVTDPANWSENANNPVFGGSFPDINVYGAGTMSEFSSPDGTQTWFTYHAFPNSCYYCGDQRETYVQQLSWNSDGTPSFPRPVARGTAITLPSGDPNLPSSNPGSFSTGFESGNSQTSWTNTVDNNGQPGGGSANIGGICCGLSGPEAGTRNEIAHNGSTALMYSGSASNASGPDYAYMQVFDLSGKNITVGSGTMLSYWIYPQSSSSTGLVSGNNSTCVAIDLIFQDGSGNLSNLRDSGATDQNGNQAHPAHQCGKLTFDTWNQVTVNLGTHSNGLKIIRLDVGYDQPNSTGGYRGYIDDVSIA